MTHSEQINEIAAALSLAQRTMRGAKKDSSNPHFKSRYADLSSVWDACRDALTAQGLAVVQSAGHQDGALVVTTMLVHTSGQWFRDAVMVPVKDSGPQALGSAITYGRRYTLAAFVGVAPEDDDAEAAEARTAPPAPPQAQKPANYDAWVAGASTVAEAQGLKALETYFKAASLALRTYATTVDKDTWKALKVKAAQTPEVEA
jgi:hypothetical protein